MSKDGLWVVNGEFDMILIWNLHQWLVIYVVMNLVWATTYFGVGIMILGWLGRNSMIVSWWCFIWL